MTTTKTYPAIDLTEDGARAIANEGRGAVITAIRRFLKERSGIAWSVTGGTGTAWGWITVTAPPARRAMGMTEEDRVALADLTGRQDSTRVPADRLAREWVIPSSSDYYVQALQIAAGQPVTVHATPYWD